MNAAVLIFIILAVFTFFWLKGWVELGGIASIYRKIRLVGLLWAAAILTIGGLRIAGLNLNF